MEQTKLQGKLNKQRHNVEVIHLKQLNSSWHGLVDGDSVVANRGEHCGTWWVKMVIDGDPKDWVAVVLLPVADALVVQLGVHILVLQLLLLLVPIWPKGWRSTSGGVCRWFRWFIRWHSPVFISLLLLLLLLELILWRLVVVLQPLVRLPALHRHPGNCCFLRSETELLTKRRCGKCFVRRQLKEPVVGGTTHSWSVTWPFQDSYWTIRLFIKVI